MAEKCARLRQRLSGVSEQRVLATGILRLHEELVAGRSVDIMQLPVRANGTPRVLQASFFKRLLAGQLELKSCMESDVSGAQSDLRHLSAEQLLAIRAATNDFFTESASHSAHRNFQATLDVQLFGKLAFQSLRGCAAPPDKPDALGKLGFHMALMLGAAELLATGWGEGSGEGQPSAPDCWLVKLDDMAWSNCSFALFRTSEVSVEVLTGKRPDILAAAAGSHVAVLNDQSVDVGKDRTLNWEVSLLDPAVDDVLAEVALLQRSPMRVPPAGRRSSSAPCAKKLQPNPGAATWGAAQGAGERLRRLEDLPRLLDNPRGGLRLAPELQKAKMATPTVTSEEPPLPPPAVEPEEAEKPGTPSEKEAEATEAEAEVEVPHTPSEPCPEPSTEMLESSALGASEVPQFLQAYGYRALNDVAWQGCDLPVARLRVSEHTEADGHTHYVLDCALFACTGQGLEGGGAPVLTWQASKRLLHLRKGLHDLVKRRLGDAEYGRLFGHAPFARHMGLPGTTSRLRTWCQTLASCMSAGLLGPALVAEVLRFLDAPAPPGGATAPPSGEEVPPLPGAALGSPPAGAAAPAPRKGRPSLMGSSRARSVPYRKARSDGSSRA